MHIPARSWGSTPNQPESNSLAITRQRIQSQLAAVVELSEHNTNYLEPFERVWIESIISEAISVTSDTESPANSVSLQSEKWDGRTSGLGVNLSAPELRPRGSARFATQDDMSTLLAASRGLNTANSLLSCCYDRWSWLQSSQAKRNSSQSNADDLQELLGRRRQQRKHSSNVPPQLLEHAQPPRRHNTNSTNSSRVATTTNEGSENSLSLVVDDTIEKWRKNAEDALNETTARLQTGIAGSHRSPSQQHSPDLHKCRLCMTERESLLFISEDEPTSVATYSPTKIRTHRSSLSSSRPPAQQSCPVHMRTPVACCERYSEATSPRAPQLQFDAFRAAQPAFEPTLHNSFDKEIINTIPEIRNNILPTSPPMTPPIHSSSCRHSRSATASHVSPPILQATLVSAEPRTKIASGPFADGTTDFTQRKNFSTASVQSKSSGDPRTSQSRGRRWLEHQCDRMPQ